MRSTVRLSALAAILGLLAMMLGPAVHLPGPATWTDKVAHLVGFLAIALALQIVPVWRNRLGAALAAVAIGALVEVIQGEIGRDRSLLDLVADAAGAGLAWLISPLLAPLLDWLEGREAPRRPIFAPTTADTAGEEPRISRIEGPTPRP